MMLKKITKTKILSIVILVVTILLITVTMFSNRTVADKKVAGASTPILSSTPISGTDLNYRNSWFANTHSGINDRAVLHSVDAIAVDPATGSVYTNTHWEEGGMQISQLRDGGVVKYMPNTFGWGRTGGHAVAVNSQYVWGAVVYSGDDACSNAPGQLNSNGLLDNRLCGTTWTGMARYKNTLIQGNAYDAEFTNFPTGYATGAYLLIDPNNTETHRCNPSGAVATETELFISDYCNNKIRVYDTESMLLLREFSVLKPGKLTLDKQGNLWILSLKDTPSDYQIGDFRYTYSDTEKILRYTIAGVKLPQEITGSAVRYARGLAVNSRNDLLVAIGGESDRVNAKQQIFFYNNIDSSPAFYKTFGEEGGYYGGDIKGQVKDGKFDWITGLAVDDQDNIYISMQKIGIASYKEDGTKNWQVNGLLFLDSTASDPRNPNIFYSKWDKFEFDPNRPDGANWKHLARIYDFKQYPTDLRNWFAGQAFDALPIRVCYLNDTKFLIMQIFGGVAGYRFDKAMQGEIAIPAFEIMPGTNLSNDVYIWTDSNGDGLIQAGEKVIESGDINYAHGIAADEDCGIWFAQNGKKNVEDHITHYNPSNLKAGGFSPDYTIAGKTVYQTPNEVTSEEIFEPEYITVGGNLKKLQYDKASDVMYISGFPDINAQNTGDPRSVGSKLYRYNNWSNLSTRTLAWTVDIPHPLNPGNTTKGTNLSLAGDYIVIGEERGDYGQFLYDKNTGQRYFLASDVQGNYGLGWLDIPYGAALLNYRPDGTYLITTEDDHYSKSFTYHIKPNSHNSIITGQLFSDNNNDGILNTDETGENLPAGTKIKLTSTTNPNLVFYPIINTAGDFAQSLPTGTYNIEYILPNGYRTAPSSLTSVDAEINMIVTTDITDPIGIQNSGSPSSSSSSSSLSSSSASSVPLNQINYNCSANTVIGSPICIFNLPTGSTLPPDFKIGIGNTTPAGECSITNPSTNQISCTNVPVENNSNSNQIYVQQNNQTTPTGQVANLNSTATLDPLFIFDDKITLTPNPITTGLSIFGNTDYTITVKDDRIVTTPGGALNSSTAVCTYRVKELSAQPGDNNRGYTRLTSTIISPHNNQGTYSANSTVISSTASAQYQVDYNTTGNNLGTSIKITKENQKFTDYNLEIRCKRNSDGQLFARDERINFLFGAYSVVTVSGVVV